MPFIPDCGALASMPSALTLACGDGNYGLEGMSWRDWGSATATGTGSARANDCKPYCAAGRFRTYPVTLTASRLRTCLTGARQYTTLVLHYGAVRPAGIGRSDTWKFPCDVPGPGPTLTATVKSGRMVALLGSGWQQTKQCGRVLLAYAGPGAAHRIALPPGKGSGVHVSWRAPRAGIFVIVASQTCGGPRPRFYKRAVVAVVG